MGQHVKKFEPGRAITFVAGGTIVAGTLVKMGSTDRTVVTADANAAGWVGVAATDAASGENVLVEIGGVQEIHAASTVAVGDLVVPAASGKIAALAGAGDTYAKADVNNARAVVGVALAGIIVDAQTDTRIEILLFR